MKLNPRALVLCERMIDDSHELRIAVHRLPQGPRILDLGVDVPGGLEAGRRMAEVCLSGLGQIGFFPVSGQRGMLKVSVRTDHPLFACMASQYAGWQITHERYFAMGSGPMRAAAGREPLFDTIGYREAEGVAVGVLESSRLPSPEVCRQIAEKCGIEPANLTLLVSPTASQAGTVQIVARCLETALHKLLELGFDLRRVESGFGTAPLPPVAGSDMEAMGRTNDAILYGGEVTLWVRGSDDDLSHVGADVPSSSSKDHGRPFARVFEHYGGDFYAIDPLLFGPAVVTFYNLDSGRSHSFGRTVPELLEQSFAGTAVR